MSFRWDCLIIVNIRAEDESNFKDYNKKDAEWFVDKNFIPYKYCAFKFQSMVGFEQQIWVRVSRLKIHNFYGFLL